MLLSAVPLLFPLALVVAADVVVTADVVVYLLLPAHCNFQRGSQLLRRELAEVAGREARCQIGTALGLGPAPGISRAILLRPARWPARMPSFLFGKCVGADRTEVLTAAFDVLAGGFLRARRRGRRQGGCATYGGPMLLVALSSKRALQGIRFMATLLRLQRLRAGRAAIDARLAVALGS